MKISGFKGIMPSKCRNILFSMNMSSIWNYQVLNEYALNMEKSYALNT